MLAVALLAGCAAPRVPLGNPLVVPAWDGDPCAPGRPRLDWDPVRDRFTRHLHITRDYDTALDARVLLVTPEVRVAYLRRVARMRCLPREDYDRLARLLADEDARWVDLWVVMETSRWDWNDLGSTHSLWTVTLIDDAGHEASAVELYSMGEKPAQYEALFATESPFARVWRVRFPRQFPDGTPLLRPDMGWVGVRFAGPLGHDGGRWISSR
jgi:hypothetical protein